MTTKSVYLVKWLKAHIDDLNRHVMGLSKFLVWGEIRYVAINEEKMD